MPAEKKIVVRPRRFAHLKGIRYEVDCGKIDGARLRKFFKIRTEADAFAGEQRRKLRVHGESSLALTEDERIQFQAARDRLAGFGVTLTEAVEFYIASHKPLSKSIRLPELLSAAVFEKELEGCRPQSISQFSCSCNSFIKGRELLGPHEVTREIVEAWIRGQGFAPKTMRVYLGDLSALLTFAVRQGFAARNPIAGRENRIKLPKIDDAEITAFDVDPCVRLLSEALLGAPKNRELIGYFAAAMFCGVRPQEIKRTPLDRLDTRERTLIVTGGNSKTRKRRVIELGHAATAWLRLWQRLCPGAAFVPKNFTRRWRALRKAAKVTAWPHDVLRHTFASYHYAQHGNTALLQSQMGHTEDEDTLFRHYRAVQTLTGRTVSKKLAAEFWALTPRQVRLMKHLRKNFADKV